jgi:hypothetical protein
MPGVGGKIKVTDRDGARGDKNDETRDRAVCRPSCVCVAENGNIHPKLRIRAVNRRSGPRTE